MGREKGHIWLVEKGDYMGQIGLENREPGVNGTLSGHAGCEMIGDIVGEQMPSGWRDVAVDQSKAELLSLCSLSLYCITAMILNLDWACLNVKPGKSTCEDFS